MRLDRNPVLLLLGVAVALSGCGVSPSHFEAKTSALVAQGRQKTDPQLRTFRTLQGTISVLLPDDSHGLKHQLFRFKTTVTDRSQTVQCAHNIDLAPYVPLKVGDTVEIKGVFIKTTPLDVIHWTHHDPSGGEGGYIKVNGHLYQ